MAKKQKKPDPIIMADLAVVSFGDMMTLMLTFFILLFSMSEIRKEKIVATLNNFRLGQGIMPFQKTPVQTFVPSQRVTQRQARQLRQGQRGREPERVTDRDPPQQYKIVFGGEEMFEPDGARLTDRAKNRLREVVPGFEGYKNVIEIRGHTAASFDATRDPWRVGYERAYNTMRFLKESGIDERRFRLVSFGDTQPIDPRDPAANRRVEIVMTDQLVRDEVD